VIVFVIVHELMWIICWQRNSVDGRTWQNGRSDDRNNVGAGCDNWL